MVKDFSNVHAEKKCKQYLSYAWLADSEAESVS